MGVRVMAANRNYRAELRSWNHLWGRLGWISKRCWISCLPLLRWSKCFNDSCCWHPRCDAHLWLHRSRMGWIQLLFLEDRWLKHMASTNRSPMHLAFFSALGFVLELRVSSMASHKRSHRRSSYHSSKLHSDLSDPNNTNSREVLSNPEAAHDCSYAWLLNPSFQKAIKQGKSISRPRNNCDHPVLWRPRHQQLWPNTWQKSGL